MKDILCSALTVGSFALCAADAVKIEVDFSASPGRIIKPLHWINNSPVSLNKSLPELQEAGIPFVRLHDTYGAYGGNCYVDVTNIFLDFSSGKKALQGVKTKEVVPNFSGVNARKKQLKQMIGVL